MRRLCNKFVAELAWKIEHRLAVWKDAGLRLNEVTTKQIDPGQDGWQSCLAGYSLAVNNNFTCHQRLLGAGANLSVKLLIDILPEYRNLIITR